MKLPWATLAIIGALAIAWIVAVATGVDAWSPVPRSLIGLGGSGGPGATDSWRIATAWTVHAGAVHLVFDLGLIAIAGVVVERRIGWPVVAIAIGGAIASAAVSRWWNPYTLSVGASGAAFALAGALAVLALGRQSRTIPLIALGVFAVANVIAGSIAPAIDHAAHAGGAVTGVVMAAIGTRRIRLAAAVAMPIAVAIAALTTASTPYDLAPVISEIDAIEARYDALLESTAPPALARAIERDVAAPLAALVARLAAAPAMPDRLRARVAATRRYVELRGRALALYVQYLDTGDTRLRDRIVRAGHAAAEALAAMR